MLLDLASHHIDLLRWFLSDEVAETKAEIASLAAEGDQAWLSLRMKSGVGTRGFFSFQAGRADWLEFLGESGTLRVDRHRPSLSLRVSRRWGYGVRSAFPFPPSDVLRWWVTRLPRPSYEPSYRSALAAFIASIQGKKTDLASLEDGVRSLEVVLAAEHSARNGNP